MSHLLQEAGVTYTRNAKVAIELGLKMYEYKWEMSKKNVEGKHFIYVKNKSDLMTLINYWNHSDFKYWY